MPSVSLRMPVLNLEKREGKRIVFLNAWFNFYLLPSPPGNPGDKSSPWVSGVGNCLKPSCPGGGRRGKSKTTSCCSFEVRHFSVDAGPRGEDWLVKNNLSKLKSVFEGTFIITC